MKFLRPFPHATLHPLAGRGSGKSQHFPAGSQAAWSISLSRDEASARSRKRSASRFRPQGRDENPRPATHLITIAR